MRNCMDKCIVAANHCMDTCYQDGSCLDRCWEEMPACFEACALEKFSEQRACNSNASTRNARSSILQGLNSNMRNDCHNCERRCHNRCSDDRWGVCYDKCWRSNCLQSCNGQKFSEAYDARDRYQLRPRAKQFSVQPQCSLVSRPNEGYPLALADMRPCGPPSCPAKPWPQGNLRSVRSLPYY
jgi:hypothetical protein